MKNICRIKNDIKVSIIIPVFNGERYIEECLNSVENQTYTNVEIIVINDGSTDKTENILLSFQEKFNNIIKITTKNSGAASARNLGMDAAKGEYIMFVDADDILLPNASRRITN